MQKGGTDIIKQISGTKSISNNHASVEILDPPHPPHTHTHTHTTAVLKYWGKIECKLKLSVEISKSG